MPVQPTSASGVSVTVIQAINGCYSISRRRQSDSAQLGGARDILQVTRSDVGVMLNLTASLDCPLLSHWDYRRMNSPGSIASYGIIFNERLASYNPWLRIDRTSSRRTTVGPKTDREVFLDFTRLALPWRTAPSRASPPGRHRPLGRGRRRALATPEKGSKPQSFRADQIRTSGSCVSTEFGIRTGTIFTDICP